MARVAKGDAVVGHIAQGEGAIPLHGDVVHLNIGLQIAEVVLGRQSIAHLTVPLVIVDGGDLQIVLQIVIINGEQLHIPHHFWA